MDDLIDSLEQIVYSGIAITTAALQHSAGADLTLTQWRAIVIVGQGPDGCRVSELARQVQVTVPATSRLLRRLERRRLIELSDDDADGRATRARLTREGSQLRSSVLAIRRERLRSIANSVPIPASVYPAVRDLANRFHAETE